MAHFFFHVRDGRTTPDLVGMTLPDLKSARREALILAGSLLAGPTRRFWHIGEWSIDVTNGRDDVLFTLTFYQSVAASILAQARTGHPDEA